MDGGRALRRAAHHQRAITRLPLLRPHNAVLSTAPYRSVSRLLRASPIAGFRIGTGGVQGAGVFDDLVVLLGDEIPGAGRVTVAGGWNGRRRCGSGVG